MAENAAYFAAAFEVARRHKIRNPDKMRTAYGQLMCVLQDSTRDDVQGLLNRERSSERSAGLPLVAPIVTVHSVLEKHDALHVLHDEAL